MGDPIRVLLVDDSSLARSMLRSILEEDGGFEIVAEAANGREAVALVRELRPELVTMDLEMPVMDGLEAIEEIMCSKAVPILVVSGVADAQKAYAAVSRGAIEVVGKPGLTPAEAADFVDKARLVSKIPVITHPRARTAPPPPPAAGTSRPVAAPATVNPRIIAIASSTGGPQALAEILGKLPAGLGCPVVVAQHIADGFAAGMADWLCTVSPVPVRLGVDGELLVPGTVVLSPSETNMTVTPSRRIALAPRIAGQVYRPSCDALLASVAAACGRDSVGVILTGMGSDGVKGMEAIRAAGGMTLAQDEGSSVIFGMNAIAIDKGWVQKVLPLDELARALAQLGQGVPA
ncbi:MAG: chemotaxis-specific protein-glutamate methyltransferase CheB [Actinomycetota bacterium]